ncbi:hypothetical protein [Saccharospirillum alexandrii]|uniref:hypothetical protein n=1 Tax=Saccharospirillum alexandrii TaxID=2448477 RepID=UPI000FD80902|nr:hypothetical protein [Saccharospirillum alexandrii]
MSNSPLTPKQAYYLKQLQDTEANGQSMKALAKQLSIRIDAIYNYRYTLRKKGWLVPVEHASCRVKSADSSIVAVPSTTSTSSIPDAGIELKTQLANGQPVWMTVPASRLRAVLAALSS